MLGAIPTTKTMSGVTRIAMAHVPRPAFRRRATQRRTAPSTAAATTDDREPRRGSGRGQRGQSLAEFALVLVPLSFLLMGIIQMGIIFNGYVTLANATREGAREATVYFYDRTMTKSGNDTARATATRTSLKSAMGLLPIGSPWMTDADIVITYSLPTGVPETDPRRGQYVTVRATYKMDLIIPLIGAMLPRDANGRMPLVSQTTMTVN